MTRPSAPIPSPADMVLDPGPRGIVSPSLTGAGVTPRLDTEGFLAADRGRAAVGAGIRGAGGALVDLSLKYAQAKSVSHQAEAQRAMLAAETAIALETAAEPDETKWPDIASRHIERTRLLMDAIPMAAVTAEHVRGEFDRWSLNRQGRLELEAKKYGIHRALGDVKDRIDLAKLKGDRAALEANLRTRRQLGEGNAAADDLEREDFDQTQKRKAEDSRREARQSELSRLDAAMEENPFVAADALEAGHFHFEDATDRLEAKARVEQAMRLAQVKGVNGAGGLRDRIVTGEADDGVIEQEGAVLRIGAEEVAKLKEFRQKLAEAKAAAAPLDSKAVAQLFGEVSLYKGDETSDPVAAQWGALVQRAEVLTAAGGKEGDLTRGVLMQQLYSRHPFQSRRPGAEAVPDFVEKEFVATIEALAADGAFGVEKNRVARNFKILPDGTQEQDGWKEEPNPNAKVRMVQVQGRLWNELVADYSANPDKWNDPHYLQQWLFGKDGKTGKLSGYRAGAQVEKMRSAGAGPGESYLFPAYVQPPDEPTEEDLNKLLQ